MFVTASFYKGYENYANYEMDNSKCNTLHGGIVSFILPFATETLVKSLVCTVFGASNVLWAFISFVKIVPLTSSTLASTSTDSTSYASSNDKLTNVRCSLPSLP